MQEEDSTLKGPHKADELLEAINKKEWGKVEELLSNGAQLTLTDDDLARGWDLWIQYAQEYASTVANNTVDTTKQLYTNLEKMALGTKDYVVEAFQEK